LPVAVHCPSCAARINVSDTMLGRDVKCPKCGQPFRTPDAQQAVRPDRPPPLPTPQVHPDRTIPRRDADRSPFADLDDDRPRRRPRRRPGASHSLGIASLILGVVALVLSLIPCVGLLSLPLSGLGLLLGFGGACVALVRSGHGIGYPVAGLGLNLVALVIGLVWLGLIGAFSTAVDEVAKHKNATAQVAEAKPPPANTPRPEQAKQEWINAQDHTAVQGDVRVGITSAVVDFVQLNDITGRANSKERLLILRVRLENQSDTRKVEYQGWGHTTLFDLKEKTPVLKDNFGNAHHRARWQLGVTVPGQVVAKSIRPKETLDDVLIFDRPVDKAEFLRLELPASAFGGTGWLRFQIPKEMIVSQ
jgi:predicted Zn finger-like uncharacterized protein